MALPLAARTLLLCAVSLSSSMLYATLPGHNSVLMSAAQAAEGDSGLLRVHATVPGAEIYVDNEFLGQSPLTSYLAPGKHMVRVVADSHDPFVRRVNIQVGKTVDLTADLLPGHGTVEFVVEPTGATLVLNGSDRYPTPVRLRDLQPGDYLWHLEADGHEAADGKFSFTEGHNLLLVQTLDSSAGRFSIGSRPDGAEVYLDGQPMGVTPLELEGVPPGVHQVLLDMEGFATIIRTVDTSDGSKGQVNTRISDSGAALVVKTPSPDAVVRLNGLKVGTGRRVRVPKLERGRYTLQVAQPGQDPVDARIEVPDKGSASWKLHKHDGATELAEFTPVARSWVFWAGAAAVAGGATAGGVVAYNATIPDPTPAGDILVTLP